MLVELVMKIIRRENMIGKSMIGKDTATGKRLNIFAIPWH